MSAALTDLLPCPFCGSSGVMEDLAGWEIHCSNNACGIGMVLDKPDQAPLVEAWNIRAAIPAQPATPAPVGGALDAERAAQNPTQPLITDARGTLRFKENAIVQYLLKNGGIDLNMLAYLEFSQDDREQFAQLIGYSLGGFAELSYVSDETYDRAQQAGAGQAVAVPVGMEPVYLVFYGDFASWVDAGLAEYEDAEPSERRIAYKMKEGA